MRRDGFTLPELIIVIVILGIVGAVAGIFIKSPIDAYLDQVRRATLVDSAEMVLRRMAIDIRRAVPNSVRTHNDAAGCAGAGQCLEMLNALNGARYRDQASPGPGGGNQAARLRFNSTDDQFNVQGPFTPLAGSTAHWLVIYNLGSGDANAYNVGGTPNVITPNGTDITINTAPAPFTTGVFDGEFNVILNPAHQFLYESPSKRIYLVDKPVMFQCIGGAMWRYEGYAFGPNIPMIGDPLSPPGGFSPQLVARNVTGCEFGYDAGTSTRAALVTMRITLAEDGETVTLMHQVHVENSP